MIDRFSFDIVILGAGIAGASVAAALGDRLGRTRTASWISLNRSICRDLLTNIWSDTDQGTVRITQLDRQHAWVSPPKPCPILYPSVFFRTSPDIIQFAVMLFGGFSLLIGTAFRTTPIFFAYSN